MGWAIESFNPKQLDRRYPMLPATIMSINQGFQETKQFGSQNWQGGYQPDARQALQEILEHRMHNRVDEYLGQMPTQRLPDRRTGYYRRHLLSALENLE